MTRLAKRFHDIGYYAMHWVRQGVDVCCPNCQSHGTITVQQAANCTCGRCLEARFCCSKCVLVLEHTKQRRMQEIPTTWYGGIQAWGRRRCGACGHTWVSVSQTLAAAPGKRPATLLGKCTHCLKEQDVDVHWVQQASGRSPIDMFFGLPLIFQAEIGLGQSIWGYNRVHLLDLLDYVSADLREKKCSGSGTYFMRLPSWVKSAKNRKKITHAIEQLLQLNVR